MEITFAEVGVDAHVTSRAGEIFVFSVRNVLVRGGVDVLLGETKIDDVNDRVLLRGVSSDQEVFRFHVPKY